MNTTDPKQAEESYVVEKGRRILMMRRPRFSLPLSYLVGDGCKTYNALKYFKHLIFIFKILVSFST